jgi:hypothetical protein
MGEYSIILVIFAQSKEGQERLLCLHNRVNAALHCNVPHVRKRTAACSWEGPIDCVLPVRILSITVRRKVYQKTYLTSCRT